VTTISVIIPTHNHAQYVRDAIDSALDQTLPPLEVIVIDDGSTDATPEMLAAYGRRIRTIRQSNRGVGAARNTGIGAARGDCLSFLDSDDEWMPRKLERQMARLAADPALGIVHCAAERFDTTGTTAPGRLTGLEGWVREEILRFDREVIVAPGSSLLVPRQVAEEAGGFDERLPPSEDWDFCCRVAERHRVGYVPEVLVRYRQHPRGIHLDIPGMERAMLLALEKQFASPDDVLQPLKRHSYGRLHRILAGCYFERRQPRAFVRHLVKSLRYDPSNAGYFAAYPWRVIARARARATRSR
jgi:glycosyltransferase involved in cell wall biosynthesis